MASLSSFISTNQYTKETTSNPLIAGMMLGSTYAGVTFNGVSGAAGNNPGGLFGWLIYSRKYLYSPSKGTTGDQYILYTTPQDLVGDLNKLDGITAFMVSPQNSGGTYGLFENVGTEQSVIRLAPTSIGYDFLHAINYMAYGGYLLVTGTTYGFTKYQLDTDNKIDILIGKEATSSLCQWLIDQTYSAGVFPSAADSAGVTGNGLTLANYASLFGSSSYVTGTTVANRMFNVYGIKKATDIDTSTLINNSKITYSMPAVGDVGGFFARSKNKNLLYSTVAGQNLSKVLNGTITNAIEWNNSLKNTLRTNRLNFFVNSTNSPMFLGCDLTGATANSTISAEDRIGVAKLKSAINDDLTTIGLKYLFEVNDSTTRSHVTSEIKTALSKYAQFVVTSATQIICDSTNNTDYATTLTMSVVIQPILSLDSLGITVTVTQ